MRTEDFNSFGKTPSSAIAGSYGKAMLSIVRNGPAVFLPKWLYHFAFPPAMNQSSCSASLPACGGGGVLDCSPSSSLPPAVAHWQLWPSRWAEPKLRQPRQLEGNWDLGPREVVRKSGLGLQSSTARLWRTEYHLGTCDSAPCLSPMSQCHLYGDSAPPPCQWMPPLSCHDRQYLPQPPPFSPSWLLLPYVIIIARESPLRARSHASITASPLPAPLASTASPL